MTIHRITTNHRNVCHTFYLMCVLQYEIIHYHRYGIYTFGDKHERI